MPRSASDRSAAPYTCAVAELPELPDDTRPPAERPGSRRRPARSVRTTSLGLVGVAAAAGVLLVALDAVPGFLASDGHRALAAAALALVAVAGLFAKIGPAPHPHELLKRSLLSAAFLLWSANQLIPSSTWGAVANDGAVALFVLDLALIVRDEVAR